MTDYMVMEAVFLKVQKAEADAEREAARKEFKRDIDHLKKFQ